MEYSKSQIDTFDREEVFLARVGAYSWQDLRGKMGSVGRLFDTGEEVRLPKKTDIGGFGPPPLVSLAHLTALRFLWHDIADLIAFEDLPSACNTNHRSDLTDIAVANLRSAPFSLASVYGETNLAGELSRRLEHTLRWPWERDRMWLGYKGQDVLRLAAIIWDDRAPLSEAFFDNLPQHLRAQFWQDGDLAGQTAIIPEPRNEYSLLTSQFHAAVLAMHNTFVSQGERLSKRPDNLFQHAQFLTRRGFHATILGDVVPRFCHPDSITTALVRRAEQYQARANHLGATFLPIEAAAVFELLLGQSEPTRLFPNMSRFLSGRPLRRDQFKGTENRLPLGLMASPRIPTRLSADVLIDWALVIASDVGEPITTFTLPRYLHDIYLASGQSAARLLGLPVLGPADVASVLEEQQSKASPLTDYLVAESILLAKNGRLGPLGSFILAETLVGLLGGDMSHLRSETHRRLDSFLGVERQRVFK